MRMTVPILTACWMAMASGFSLADEPRGDEGPIRPKETISLFNGKDLQGLYTWLEDTGREDPRRVFFVQDGILAISGDGWGGIATEAEYRDYHLTVEFKWGDRTWGRREKSARDSGILLHCIGPDGGYGGQEGKPGPWMTSIECQIIEGGVGDLLVVGGKDEEGAPIPASLTAEVEPDRDGEPCWSRGGSKKTIASGRVNWFGRDPDWKDEVGFRGKLDVESPHGEWTRVECDCDGDRVTILVNGQIVNEAERLVPSAGKILLQTEGAEIFIRKFELRPIDERPK